MNKRKKIGFILLLALFLCTGCVGRTESLETVKNEGDVQIVEASSWSSIRDGKIHNVNTVSFGNTAIKIQKQLLRGMEMRHLFIDNIPIYEIRPIDSSSAKMVIFLHGQYSRKEEFLADMVQFAENGYCCVTIDLACHGERINSTPVMSLEITKQTAQDIDVVLDFYRSCHIANADEIALVGFSQGGSVAYFYTAYGEICPNALVVGSTTPDYTYYVEDISIKDGRMSDSIWTEEEIDRFVEDNNPVNNISRFYSVPILSGNNTKDPIISYKGSESFEMQLHHMNSELRFYYYESSDHNVPENFILKILPFIKEHL